MKSLHSLIITISLLMPVSLCQDFNAASAQSEESSVRIHRFDKELFQLIESRSTQSETRIAEVHSKMLTTLGKGVLNMQSPEMPGFFDKLVNFYSEPTLNGLYKDAINSYSTIDDFETELGNAFTLIKTQLPSIQIPMVYMHVSGLSQNILVGEQTLSISIDKYLGKEYPLYQNFFHDYQLRTMTKEQVVPDYIAGLIMSEYPFSGNENVLLERMIYEGKIKYIQSRVLPNIPAHKLLCYEEADWTWCKNNEGPLWKSIITRKHLYSPDQTTTNRYFLAMPSTFIADNAPGNIGTWIGWQIVEQYMKETKTSIETLMNNNAQEILTKSKYKP